MVVRAAVRRALEEHSREEDPNEACGLILLRNGVAEEYVRGTNKSPSPYRFELEIDPLLWDEINDADWEQAVFHSHLSSPAYPSRTDVESIGLWERQLYVIYSVARDELAAFRIEDGRIEQEPVTEEASAA